MAMQDGDNWPAELLVCPQCGGGLSPDLPERGYLCLSCSVLYPLNRGIISFLQPQKVSDEQDPGS
jgi:uncharacterized protein YbaR (Trm112 family)